MKLREIMTPIPVHVEPDTTVDVAARLLTQYNIGMLPVCTPDGALHGLVTDRDIVTRCLAAGRSPAHTGVRDVMTRRIVSAPPHMETSAAAHLMGREQIRRLPILEDGRLRGIVSLGDLAEWEESSLDASDALTEISTNLSRR